MWKRLTEEKQAEILETGIAEFAKHGVDHVSMSSIAEKTRISVGVLYKYYADKNAFFDACLQRSLNVLRETLDEVTAMDGNILSLAESLIRTLQRCAAEHSSYMRMYLQITAGSNGVYARRLADAIEGISAEVYTKRIAQAQARGDVRRDMDPKLFAFFFDSLLMMMQFSYCADYYQARFRRYCGADVLEDNDRVAKELLKFFESAFTLEQADIHHSKKGAE